MAGAVRQKGWAEHKEHDQQNEKFSSNPVAFVFTLMDEKRKLTQFCLFKNIPAKNGLKQIYF
jgi:hypothetical protein